MLIKKIEDIKSREISPQDVYLHRRRFLKEAGLLGAVAAVGQSALGSVAELQAPPTQEKLHFIKSPLSTTGEDLTPFKDVTTYNNFYEFGVGKDDPARHAGSLRTRPWTVSVEGLISSPKTYDVDSILKMHPSLEERVYRMRCVEGWSMVIPWIGIPLNSVIRAVQPLSKAAYVAFETLYAPTQMPGQQRSVLEWPYVEGLRMDEAMHPLTILAVGLYGAVLPNQNGAPLRLVVPWKYGYKSIKSIVRIKFVEKKPPTSWNRENSFEYGFYSNVNPAVDHPRWSQAKERRIGEFFKRNTLPFNGYADQVAGLYAGMDLKKFH